MHKKKISIIGIVGVPAEYGGFETFADYLSKYISSSFDLTIYCSSKSYKEKKLNYNKAKLKYIRLKATGVQSIPYDILSILYSIRYNDVLLVLGSSGAIILPLVSFFTKKKIIFNMAGLEWKRSKWNKLARWYLKFSENIAVKYADVTVVDNQGLQEYILSEYQVRSEVIAYGGDQVKKLLLTDALKEKYSFLNAQYYVAVARIQPDNNIDIILEAFKEMPEQNLVFIGNWNYSDYGIHLKNKFSTCTNINLLDAIYDLNILDQIRSNCVAYIHGHSSGGTNPSLVEAMHLELPIIAFDVNFNRYTTKNEAFYFSSVNQLVDQIIQKDSDLLSICAKKMKFIANQLYTWRYIIEAYERLF